MRSVMYWNITQSRAHCIIGKVRVTGDTSTIEERLLSVDWKE